MKGNEFVVFQFNTNIVLREICLFAYPIRRPRLMDFVDVYGHSLAQQSKLQFTERGTAPSKGYRISKNTYKFGSLISRNSWNKQKKKTE